LSLTLETGNFELNSALRLQLTNVSSNRMLLIIIELYVQKIYIYEMFSKSSNETNLVAIKLSLIL